MCCVVFYIFSNVPVNYNPTSCDQMHTREAISKALVDFLGHGQDQQVFDFSLILLFYAIMQMAHNRSYPQGFFFFRFFVYLLLVPHSGECYVYFYCTLCEVCGLSVVAFGPFEAFVPNSVSFSSAPYFALKMCLTLPLPQKSSFVFARYSVIIFAHFFIYIFSS